ncbi:MAG: ATP-dependent DNA helicase [Desulfurivibrionaceae bacterium]|nr:ATP-dependent DNA helicase [Desulfurivibrionaceae bacterium]
MNDDSVMADIGEVFGPAGILAGRLPGYQFREGQLKLAEAVLRGLSGPADGRRPHLLAAEAGTGIGKTLAYLVPAALSGRRVVISTGTLNLQDQILDKEIPFIRKHIVKDLSALCVKGRQNYLCLYRWHQVAAAPQKKFFGLGGELQAIGEWAAETASGDRAELVWLADNSPLWSVVSANASQCLGSDCPDWPGCFITKLRREAARSRLLIVNHHLFFSDLALRRFGNAEVLPRYEAVIFDEAHHIEETATRYFGISVSHYQLIDLARDVETLAEAELAGRTREKTVQSARALATGADRLATMLAGRTGRFDLAEVVKGLAGWRDELGDLDLRFSALAGQLDNLLPSGEVWNNFLGRCLELQTVLQKITAEEVDRAMIYWLERRERTVVLSASPIRVADELQEHLYSQVRSAVFTSATLTTANRFDFFLERLGLPAETETLTLTTPFDYRRRTLLFVPNRDFPAPGTERFPAEAPQLIGRLVRSSHGRALVLFTSLTGMREAYEYLKNELEYPVLMQGAAPRSALLEQFATDVHSVLLAVASFWEGVDVPGEALSCVIIDKLPFEVPSDPVVKARVDRVREEGGNPFFDYQVPRAILALRQGVGRLMRSASDRGVLAILDVRLFTKSYGRTFLNSLPPSPVTRDFGEVERFWRRPNGIK